MHVHAGMDNAKEQGRRLPYQQINGAEKKRRDYFL